MHWSMPDWDFEQSKSGGDNAQKSIYVVCSMPLSCRTKEESTIVLSIVMIKIADIFGEGSCVALNGAPTCYRMVLVGRGRGYGKRASLL